MQQLVPPGSIVRPSPEQRAAGKRAHWMRRVSPRPGHPDWVAITGEAERTAAELLPALDAPRTGLPFLRRRAASQRTAIANYFANRRLAKKGREDLRPLYFIWTTLRSCNFDCSYCDDHRGQSYPSLPTSGQLDTEQGVRLMKVMRTGTSSLYFAGGEPTMRKDLPTLTRAARDLDYYPIIINTNGSLVDRRLRQTEWRTWLADTDIVVVSLDALDLDELRRMWAYRKPVEVLRNLLILRALSGPMRFKLMINCVIQPGRIEHAREVMDLADDLGIWLCPVPVNVGPVVDETLLGDPVYRELAGEMLRRKRTGAKITGSIRMLERLLQSKSLSCRNSLKPHIDHDGKLFWPCKACVNVDPELIDVLQFDDVETLWKFASARVEPTRFHGPAKNQCGANCNWAQNYTTDAYAHGLTEPASLFRELVSFLR